MSPSSLLAVEWLATLSGLLGAVLVATQTPMARWGWLLSTTGSIATMCLALGIDRHGLALQQFGFACIGAFGAYRAGVVSALVGSLRARRAANGTS